MKTLKTLFFTCCMLLSFNTVAQQQVSIEEARSAAAQTINLRQSRDVTYSEARVKKVNTLKNRAEYTLMYEVIFDDGQGVLLSGSKACLPILGYYDVPNRERSIFDDDDVPDGLKFLLGEYEEQITQCFQNDTIRLYYQNEWQTLQQESSSIKKNAQAIIRASGTPPSQIIVAPLLTNQWGQDEPNAGSTSTSEQCNAYNYYTPIKDCETCRTKSKAGCVAVAMAQIMYYWKYPAYNVLQNMNVNYMGGHYDWCNMVDALNTNLPNYINERNAIAYLIGNCGDAVNMSYGCSGSSATTSKARHALVNNFAYNSNADYQLRMGHSDATWKKRIKDNLDMGRPVLYGGQSALLFPENAHTFVCDGYGSDDKFHFNFGWRGSYSGINDWFTLDDLTPPGHNYNTLQEAVFYIYPDEYHDYCNYNLSLFDDYFCKFSILLIYAYMGVPIPQSALDAIPGSHPKTATTLTSINPTLHNTSTFTVPMAWYTIEPGQTIEYVAHESITLQPGFHAKAGSNFTARIEPCQNCVGLVSSKVIYSETEEDEPEININELDNIEKGNINKYKEDTVIISPNPNEGNFIITLSGELEPNAAFEIYIENGKILYKSAIKENNQNVVFTDKPGVYIIKIINGKKTYTDRFVLK